MEAYHEKVIGRQTHWLGIIEKEKYQSIVYQEITPLFLCDE
jgi:hypothetical protein